MKPIIEICCGSYDDALNAYRGGASRIELNSALSLGGLTPSLASLTMTKKNTDLKVITMIRPRGAGFCYNEDEYEVMKQDALTMLEHGADGIAFGFLTPEGKIDRKKTGQFVDIAKFHQGEAVFHRAFDCVDDPFLAMETLIDLGVDRVLTSGLQPRAFDGADLLAKLQKKYGDRIEILVGSGVNANNVQDILQKTGVHQVHSSCKDWQSDPTTALHHVSFAYAPAPHEEDYEIVSQQLVEAIHQKVNEF